MNNLNPKTTVSDSGAFLILAAIALILRSLGMDQESLWTDEFFTWMTSAQPGIHDVLEHSRHANPHPPGYFLLMHLYLKLPLDGDAALRIPSALAGALGAGFIYLWTRNLFPDKRTAAWLTAGLLVISPMHIWYSQEARPYALQVCVALASLWLITSGIRMTLDANRLITRIFWTRCIPAMVLAVTNCWLHYYSLLVMAAVGLAWFLTGCALARSSPAKRIRTRLYWFIIVPLMGTLIGVISPLLGAFGRLGSGDGISWLPASYGVDLFFNVFRAQFIGTNYNPLAAQLIGLGIQQSTAALTAVILQWGGILAGLHLLIVGLFRIGLQRRKMAAAFIVTYLCLILLFALPVAASFVHPVIFWGQRYLIIALPVILVAVARGILGPEGEVKWTSCMLALLMIGLQILYLVDYYSHRQKHMWDVAAQYIAGKLQADPTRDCIIFTSPSYAGGLLARYLPGEYFPIIKNADDQNLVRRSITDPDLRVYFVSYRNFSGDFHSEDLLTRKMDTGVLQTHRDGQDLWIHHFYPAGKSE